MDFFISKIFLDIKKSKSWYQQIEILTWKNRRVAFFSIKNISWYQELFPDIEKTSSWYKKKWILDTKKIASFI